MSEYIIENVEKYSLIGNEVLRKTDGESLVIFLNGALGSGKTTFINHFTKELGVSCFNSASYGLVNYCNSHVRIINCDLYRTKWSEEFFEHEIYPLLENKFFLFLEWVDPCLLVKNATHISIQFKLINYNKRLITVEYL